MADVMDQVEFQSLVLECLDQHSKSAPAIAALFNTTSTT